MDWRVFAQTNIATRIWYSFSWRKSYQSLRDLQSKEGNSNLALICVRNPFLILENVNREWNCGKAGSFSIVIFCHSNAVCL